MKKLLFLLTPVVATIFFVGVTPLFATTKIGADIASTNGLVRDDLYIIGEEVRITDTVMGDVTSVGASLLIEGLVEHDVLGIGGDIALAGEVRDDVRIVGGEVTINDTIGGDLAVVGGDITVTDEASIDGDALIIAGDVILDGIIYGNVDIYAGTVTVHGDIVGDVTIHAGDIVTVSSSARITGDIDYSAPERLIQHQGATVGGVITYEGVVDTPGAITLISIVAVGVIFLTIAKVLYLFLMGFVVVSLFGKLSRDVVREVKTRPWVTILKGLVVAVVIPLVILLLFISIFGALIGVFLMVAYAFLILVAKIFATIIAGAMLALWLRGKVIVNWQWTFLGIIALQLAFIIPFFGHLISFVFLLAVLGALSSVAYIRLRKKR